MKKIYVINGFHSGKDTFVKMISDKCDEISDKCEEIDTPVINYSYVDLTRNMLLDKCIDTSLKTDTDRILLAGVNKLLEEWGDVPLKDCLRVVNDFLTDKVDAKILFVHIRDTKVIKRFVDYVKKTYDNNVKTVLIKRENNMVAPTDEDANVDNMTYDIIINNDGDMDNLREKAINFLNNTFDDCYHEYVAGDTKWSI